MANKKKTIKQKNLSKTDSITTLPILKNVEYHAEDVRLVLSIPIILGLPSELESSSNNVTTEMLQFIATSFGLITDVFEDSELRMIIKKVIEEDALTLSNPELIALKKDRRALIDRSEGFFHRNLESRLRGTIIRLLIESLFAGIGKPIPTTVRETIRDISEVTHTEKLAARGRGGDHRKAKHSWDEEEYKRFARKVTALLPLWSYITQFFHRNEYDTESMQMVKQSSRFQSLAPDWDTRNDDLIIQIYKRKYRKRSVKVTPLALSLEHARRECGIEFEYKYDSLKKYYDSGRKLLKE